jgi:DNA-directed RNA polymerase I subunit RPA1
VDISSPVHRSIKKVSFSFLTPEQVRRQSVKGITCPLTFDALNHPVVGGLYDPALGPVEKNGRCSTCGLGSAQCPGHFGHIDLCLPVYNPLTFPQLFQLLRLTCLYCHKLRMSATRSALYWGKLKLLQAGLLMDAMDLEQWHSHQEVEDQQLEEGTATTSKVSEEEQVRRITAHVNKLVKNQTKSQQQNTKSGLTAEYRRKLINEFLKKTPASSQCPHCRGYIPGLHRHAGTKIFLNPLRRNMAAIMEMKKMSPDAIFETSLSKAEESGNAQQQRFRSMNPEETEVIDEDGVLMEDIEATEELLNDEEMADEEIDDIKLAKARQMQETLNSAGSANATSGSTASVSVNAEGLKYLTPLHVMEHLKALFGIEGELLKLIFTSQDVRLRSEQVVDHRIFFTQVLAVPPCRFRPPSVFGDSSFDHPQNGYLADILRYNAKLVELGANSSNALSVSSKIVDGWIQLQEQVNYFFDSSRNTNVGMGQIPPAGIKQILEKKEGLFRKHMMGKRVNFAARSVISPDPNLDVGEIGVPMVFARKLTYPEPVTSYNLTKLQNACINGPEKYPGASHVQLEDGTLQALETLNPAARKSLATQLGPGKKVLRNLEDGDLVLMNRQPTLHKPSMMGHRVRVLTGEKTLRMHYANCDAYNADFDGDEMNMHFPQNELARSELASIASTDVQYLVPTDGSPLRGLIQDHIVTGVILTLKDTFLDAETFQQVRTKARISIKFILYLVVVRCFARKLSYFSFTNLVRTSYDSKTKTSLDR